MHPNLQIVLILTIGFTLASLFAYIAQRLRLPAILGYLLAGYAIGPYSPGFVADISLAEQLAEIGVILMLFGVGLHFKMEDLIGVKKIAIPGAFAQTVVATVATFFLVKWLGGNAASGLILGLSIGVASTVVLVRNLTDNRLINTPQGSIAIGWLIVEDIFTVVILLLLPAIAAFFLGEEISPMEFIQHLLIAIFKFLLLGLLFIKWGDTVVGFLLTKIARLRSQELFTLTLLAIVFLIATGAALLVGTSIALGAFIAGMVIGKTNVRHQASSNALPLQDIFSVLFFLSVGMLFSPQAMANDFFLFGGIVAVILIVKPLVAFLIALFLGYSLKIAITLALALAQIGEFSFILAEEAMSLKILPDEGFDLLVAAAIVSISLNPILFRSIDGVERALGALRIFRPLIRERAIQKRSASFPKIVIIGFGPIGREVYSFVKTLKIRPIIIEQNIDTVAKLETEDPIFFGDAAESNILQEIRIEEASHLLITLPDTEKTIKIIEHARAINPDIQILCRSQYVTEETKIESLHVSYVCTEQEALNRYLQKARSLFL